MAEMRKKSEWSKAIKNKEIYEIKLSFEKSDISFDSFTINQMEMMREFLKSHLIDCYEKEELNQARRIIFMINELSLVIEKKKKNIN